MSCSKKLNMNEMLVEKDGVYYTKDTNEPYTGLVFSLHNNGNKNNEGMLKNGKKDGVWTKWYNKYKKKSEGAYTNGIKEGLWTFWDKGGQKSVEGKYSNGKKDSTWTKWPFGFDLVLPKNFNSPLENVEIIVHFKDGKEIWNNSPFGVQAGVDQLGLDSIQYDSSTITKINW